MVRLSGDQPSDTRVLARAYLERGWKPIPVPRGEKGPRLAQWTEFRATDASIDDDFSPSSNIGLLLGEPSGWLVDVDLDCPEAVELADEYLPRTEAETGRPGNPRSHRWYICEGVETKQYRDPKTKEMLLELRSTGSQTLVGPSVHPSGECYEPLDQEPAVVDRDELVSRVESLYAAVLERRGHVLGAVPKSRATPRSDARARASAYLAKIPPAVSGSGGHDQTYAAATTLVHGFCLDEATALDMLVREYNPRCQPPWTETELLHKVEDAAIKPHDRPRGWLLDAGSSPAQLSHPTSAPGAPSSATKDPGPFPAELLQVPGLIGELMEFNLRTAHRRQPVLALAGAIALQAVLAGRKVRDERGNRTNLMIISIAGAGEGKDHARQINKRVLDDVEALDLEGNDEIASDAGLYTSLSEHPARLFQIDEFGRFLRSSGDAKHNPHTYNVITALLKLYSSAGGSCTGKAYSDPGKTKRIDRPCAVLHATSVPEPFYGALTKQNLEDGFVPRLLVFEGESGVTRSRGTELPIPVSIVDAAAAWWEFGQSRPRRNATDDCVVVKTAREAERLFDELAERVDQTRLESSCPPWGGCLWARCEEKACRLALVYACSRGVDNLMIDEAAARWGIGVAEYLTKRVIHLAGRWISDGAFDARQQKIIRLIDQAGGRITRTELTRRTQSLRKIERDEAIENLLECEVIRSVTTESATRGGTVYFMA